MNAHHTLFSLAITVLLTAVFTGCEDGPPGAPVVPKEPPHDDPLTKPTGERRDAGAVNPALDDRPARRDFSELTGTWQGQARTEEYGLARAELHVTGDGVVLYTVTGQGKTQSDQFRIERWDGETLRVRDDSAAYDITATLSGERLQATLPMVGQVTFERRQK